MEAMTVGDSLRSLRGGRLEGVGIPDLLWGICSAGATGVLSLQRGSVTKRVYVQEGRIVFASSSDPDDRLGECLLRDGRISLDQLEEAAARLGTGKRIGTLLVEAGHLAPHDLVRSVVGQVQEIVLGLFAWQEGEYDFREGPLPSEEVITLGMRTDELLREGLRRVGSFSRVRASVGGPRTVYRLRPGAREKLQWMSLRDGERALLERLEGEGASIETLCREVFLSNFEVYQTLWAFKVTGIVEEGARLASGSGTEALEGRLGREGFPELLVTLCRAGRTGLLHVCQGARERTFHLREGRLVFATSDSLDDGLVTYLLRRGVISVQDREQVARQLLTKKRSGVLLRDMGVLGEAELAAAVREHLLEIVHTTFLWEDGDWAFQPGELPTDEDIALELPLEQLVAGGIRRIRSLSRVRAAVGEPDTVLELTPHYLSILDRMEIGGEEWEVVSSLREPATIREVCRAVKLGSFRVYQLLWALKLLGAVREGVLARPAEPLVLGQEEVPDARGAVPEPAIEAESAVAAADVIQAAEPPTPEPAYGSAATAARQEEPVSTAPPEAAELEPAAWSDSDQAERMFLAEVEESPPVSTSEPAEPPAESPDATVAIPRAEIEAIVAGNVPSVRAEADRPLVDERPEEAAAQPAREDWQPPPELDREIASFNEKHRAVYRVIRSEVGAGAGNFVRSCRSAVACEIGELLSSVQLLPDGTWEERNLRRALVEHRVADAGELLDRILEEEIATLGALVGEARARALRERIRSLDRPAAAPP